MQGECEVDFEYVDGTIRACGGRRPPTPGGGAAGSRANHPAAAASAAEDIMDKYFDGRVLAETRSRMREADETMRLSAEIKDMAEALLFLPPATRTVSGT